jgi:hypothetical protein
MAVVSNCIYLARPGGEIIWLAKKSLPMHSRSVQLGGEWPGLLRDTPFQIRSGGLVFHAGATVDAVNAEVWRPPTIATTSCLPFSRISGQSRDFYSLLLQIPRTGFGALLEPILALTKAGGLVSTPEFSDPVLRVAWPAVHAVARGSARHDLDAILSRVDDLMGLGNGLTPSGDDFLGGLFFGLHTLNELYPAEVGLDLERVEKTLAPMTCRTNLISSIILNDLAAGQGPEPLHDLLYLLLTPASPQRFLTAARELASIGHSTGWDLLTGLLAGLLWTWPATQLGDASAAEER